MHLECTNAAMSSLQSEVKHVAKEHWEDEFNSILENLDDLPVEKLPEHGTYVGSNVGAITAAMLDGKSSYGEMFNATRINKASYRIGVLRAKRRGLITTDGQLTQLGRWCGIAFKLGISLSALCVLADMYVFRCLLWHEEVEIYTKDDTVQEKLNMKYRAMCSVYNELVKKKYAYCRSGHKHDFRPKTAYIDEGIMARLHEYMEDMFVIKKALMQR